ncbi:30S ribosomal protein S6 [Tuberibacillus calidus]|jgi:small subunit ribosomal protein S6|uniref:30S ribosomal protein S6 n=1 Tax=Tuberibacillus calidus TaxID=340097 RepID=UPI0003F88211|nr:30S ribosomal protein S6 [Tuberibacillus calidus]
MRKYEIMYILRPDLDEEAEKAAKENLAKILTDNGAEINEVQEMGKRRLAYEIDGHRNGIYVVLYVTAGTEAINEFDRLAKINENVIRFMTIRDERE